MSRTRSVLAATVGPVVLAGSCLLVAGAAPAAAATPRGLTVIAVGVPYESRERGAVDVHRPNGTSLHLTPASLGLPQTPGIQFGTAVAVADLNGDGVPDLVVGAPGNGDTVESAGVWAVFGDATGSYTAAGVRPLRTGAGLPGGFGRALAISSRADGTGHDIWVGAPFATVSGREGAGLVQRFTAAEDGTLAADAVISEDFAGVPGVAETGDLFGLVLAPASNGVVAGTPTEDVGRQQGAGAITRLRTSRADNTLIAAQTITQDSPGVPGVAEKGDNFGLAVSYNGLAVGAPGESLGRRAKAGAVQLFSAGPGPDQMAPGRSITQDTPGVPGAAEAGDLFGTAVATGTFDCPVVTSVAVGAPGETIGGKLSTGSVTVVPPAGSCRATTLYQGSGLPGTAERSDSTGAAIATVFGAQGLGEKRVDDLLIGSTFESIGSIRFTGRAILKRFSSSAAPVAFGPLGGDETELIFGNSPALYGPG